MIGILNLPLIRRMTAWVMTWWRLLAAGVLDPGMPPSGWPGETMCQNQPTAVTPGDVYEMSALVACGTGSADFNFYIGRATTATGGIGESVRGNTRTTTAWKRATGALRCHPITELPRPFRRLIRAARSAPSGTLPTGICVT